MKFQSSPPVYVWALATTWTGRTRNENNKERKGSENQEGEIIGEGQLTIVYKAIVASKQDMEMAFKVFKLDSKSVSKEECKTQVTELCKKISWNYPHSTGLAKYYDIDEDKANGDIVLLMEYINIMNAKKYIETFGKLDTSNIRRVCYQVLSLLKDLLKIDYFHGRLNLNNIHLDTWFNVKLTDYGQMGIFDREAQFTPEEGSRFDIFCLGICILKFLGLLNIDQGSDHTVDLFLENMEELKSCYTTNWEEKLIDPLIDFLDWWFEKVVTIDDLLYHTFLKFDDEGREIERKFSTKFSTRNQGLTHIISSKENSTDTLLNVNGLDSSWFKNIGQALEVERSSGIKSSRKWSSIWSELKGNINPIESYSKEFSQGELPENTDDGYEDTLRAFEISQLKQKQRKPRKSNFFPFKARLSLMKGGAQMKVIQEDDMSVKSLENSSNAKSIASKWVMESIKEE